MTNRYARQLFLGPQSEHLLHSASVAIVGIGGGGSHIAQQLAHVGIGTILLFDPDRVENSNLNRLVGASAEDAVKHEPKVRVAERMVKAINPQSNLVAVFSKWQLSAAQLREADIIVSCMDSFLARQEIEVAARRFLIPLIDVGMDVHLVEGKPHIAGQVISSVPGGPCMRCLGFLNDQVLKQEAELYGAAGEHPQVIWANGVLASVAVGLVVDFLTSWTGAKRIGEYLHYDGNSNHVTRSPRLEYAPRSCSHFPLEQIGEPRF